MNFNIVGWYRLTFARKTRKSILIGFLLIGYAFVWYIVGRGHQKMFDTEKMIQAKQTRNKVLKNLIQDMTTLIEK